MKKLFLFAALLMTGFAFYSCDDVIDNPADPGQSSTAVWNYTVNVKFADFEFPNCPPDPETSEAFKYKAPTTLYVLNEQMIPLGTITTETAPEIGAYASYSGELQGALGENLIITTATANELAKQDGTLAAAVKYGIVQTDTVPVTIYSTLSGKVTTKQVKMQNSCAIAHIGTWQLAEKDEVTVTSEDQSFKFTIPEGANTWDLYVAIPSNFFADDAKYTISANKVDGYSIGSELTTTDFALTTGKVNHGDDYGNYFQPTFYNTGVDLTVWDAYKRENDAGYMNNINNGYTNTFSERIEDGKSFIITQSGETLDYLNVFIFGTTGEEINLTLDNMRLGEDRQLQLGTNDGYYTGSATQMVCENGAKTNITLVGDNRFGRLNISCPHTANGDGTWTFNNLTLNSYGKRTVNKVGEDWDYPNAVYTKAGAASFQDSLFSTWLSTSVPCLPRRQPSRSRSMPRRRWAIRRTMPTTSRLLWRAHRSSCLLPSTTCSVLHSVIPRVARRLPQRVRKLPSRNFRRKRPNSASSLFAWCSPSLSSSGWPSTRMVCR